MHHKNSIISILLMGGFLALSLAACEAPQPPYPDNGEPTQPTPSTFPWPPPRASAMTGLTRTQVVGQAVDPTCGNVADRLERALKAAGYREYSYHMVPDGFAVVTRLEQIGRRGEALADPPRWSADPPRVTLVNFSLTAYLQALSLAAAGRYRIIALVFTPESFDNIRPPPTQREAIDWLSGGLNRLPETLRSQPYHEGFAATALIYEFSRPRARQTPPELLLPPASLSAEQHLAGSRVAAGLTP